MNIMQLLSDAGINSFAVTLLAESVLKAPLVADLHKSGKPLQFFFPVNRSDTAEWAGVEISITPVRKD